MSGQGPGRVKTVQLGPTGAFRGRRAFDAMGSTSCHVRSNQKLHLGADLVAENRPHACIASSNRPTPTIIIMRFML